MSKVLNFKNWYKLFEQNSNQGTSEFVYSTNENPTTAQQENAKNMQQYLTNMFSGATTLEGIVGKSVYLYNKPEILKENEVTNFKVAGIETKTKDNSNVSNTYLYSNAVEKVKAPFIRISNVNNIQSFKYYKIHSELGTAVYNEELMNAIRSLMGGKPYSAV